MPRQLARAVQLTQKQLASLADPAANDAFARCSRNLDDVTSAIFATTA